MPNKGFTTTYVLVFGALLLVMLGGFFGFVSFELKRGKEEIAWHRSLQTAETFIHRYRWCLNNGVEAGCSGSFDYYDLEGNQIGSANVSAQAGLSCGEEGSHQITSTGWDVDFPEEMRTLSASIGQMSVAKYAYLIDDNIWAGADREIRGLYHSNGGIRMDGKNQSLVTSAQSEWLCTSSFGCDYLDCPSDCVQDGYTCRCPGVFTTTDNASSDLFDYPFLHFDFEGISIDLSEIKDLTIGSPQSKYWPPVENIDGSGEGYHFVLKNDGTIEVRVITNLDSVWGYNNEEGWHYDDFRIANEYLYKTIDPTEDCSLIFVEDNLWIDGEVGEKMTIASADLISSTDTTNIILVDDINYVDEGDNLGLIGEGNILISPDSPDKLKIEGIFVAQKGRFGRNHYYEDTKDELEIKGTVVSKGKVDTKWSSGSVIVSGYLRRESYIDSDLIYSPPHFIPSASEDFEILHWEELD